MVSHVSDDYYRGYELSVYEDSDGLYEIRVKLDDDIAEVIDSSGGYECPIKALFVGYGFVDGFLFNNNKGV